MTSFPSWTVLQGALLLPVLRLGLENLEAVLVAVMVMLVADGHDDDDEDEQEKDKNERR